jgi:hypothetical protein
MKKINILKAIIDFIWIITVPIMAPLTLFFVIALFFDGLMLIDFEFLGIKLLENDLFAKILLAIQGSNFLLVIYCLHLFRKVLAYFKKVKIFDAFIIASFNKIGAFLIISGMITLVEGTIARIYLKGQITIEIGFQSSLLIIGLGLFFQILSEIFAIAKNAKQENNLTI